MLTSRGRISILMRCGPTIEAGPTNETTSPYSASQLPLKVLERMPLSKRSGMPRNGNDSVNFNGINAYGILDDDTFLLAMADQGEGSAMPSWRGIVHRARAL